MSEMCQTEKCITLPDGPRASLPSLLSEYDFAGRRSSAMPYSAAQLRCTMFSVRDNCNAAQSHKKYNSDHSTSSIVCLTSDIPQPMAGNDRPYRFARWHSE